MKRNKEAQRIYDYRKIHAIKRFSERYGKILSSTLYNHMCKLAKKGEIIMIVSHTKKIVRFVYDNQTIYAVYSKIGKQILTFLHEKHAVETVVKELEITCSVYNKERKFYRAFLLEYLGRREDINVGNLNKRVVSLLQDEDSCLTK